MAALAVAALPMALLAAIAPRISRWTTRRADRDQADQDAATEWLAQIAPDADDFPQTLAPTETLADYIARTTPEQTRRAA